MLIFLFILIVSFIATLLSSMSGAGSALITIPTWVLLGYSLPVAQAAGKLNGAFWTPIAARNYLQGRKIDWKLLAGLTLFGLFGAYLGSVFFVELDPHLLRRIIGAIIICLVGFAIVDKGFGIDTKEARVSRTITSFLSIPLGFYEAFFGAGNGIFSSILLAKTRGLDLILALGYYYCISFAWCLFSALLFLHWGFGDLSLIVPSSIGGVAGAYLGSKIGQRKGARFVKYFFVGLGGLLGLKLLFNL